MSTLVCFSVAGTDYEVAIEAVEEIAPQGAIVALGGVPPGVVGLSELHGQIVTVVELAKRVRGAVPERPRVLVLGDGEGRRVAMPVDTVAIADLPPAEDVALRRRFTSGRTMRGGRARWVIDPAATIAASTDDPAAHLQQMEVLLAERGPHVVAIPMASVERVVRGAEADDHGPAVVVTHASRRATLPCDRLLGERTITVQARGLAVADGGAHLGAAIDDGRVVLVLDPAGLVGPVGPTLHA